MRRPVTESGPAPGELILYRASDDAVRVEVLYETETFWLSQAQMATLFGVDVRTVNEHLRNVFGTNELAEDATIRKFRMVRSEGGGRSRERSRSTTSTPSSPSATG